jgi:hypothetical protein
VTIPPFVEQAKKKVSDLVRDLGIARRTIVIQEEQRLGPHLRGQAALYDALVALIRTRIDGRAGVPEPSDPMVAKSMIARDRELQWLLSRLESVYRSPVNQPNSDEPPA